MNELNSCVNVGVVRFSLIVAGTTDGKNAFDLRRYYGEIFINLSRLRSILRVQRSGTGGVCK